MLKSIFIFLLVEYLSILFKYTPDDTSYHFWEVLQCFDFRKIHTPISLYLNRLILLVMFLIIVGKSTVNNKLPLRRVFSMVSGNGLNHTYYFSELYLALIGLSLHFPFHPTRSSRSVEGSVPQYLCQFKSFSLPHLKPSGFCQNFITGSQYCTASPNNINWKRSSSPSLIYSMAGSPAVQ